MSQEQKVLMDLVVALAIEEKLKNMSKELIKDEKERKPNEVSQSVKLFIEAEEKAKTEISKGKII